jgi:hypothetical protein
MQVISPRTKILNAILKKFKKEPNFLCRKINFQDVLRNYKINSRMVSEMDKVKSEALE